MSRLKKTGLFIILGGVLFLLRARDGYYGWGGYVDNSWYILIISSFMIITGIILIKTRDKIK